jgi:hypothetical protein
MQTRSLKIESTGDYFRKRISPIIRLKGKWLAAAGFPPGGRIQLTHLANGVIQISASTN